MILTFHKRSSDANRRHSWWPYTQKEQNSMGATPLLHISSEELPSLNNYWSHSSIHQLLSDVDALALCIWLLLLHAVCAFACLCQIQFFTYSCSTHAQQLSIIPLSLVCTPCNTQTITDCVNVTKSVYSVFSNLVDLSWVWCKTVNRSMLQVYCTRDSKSQRNLWHHVTSSQNSQSVYMKKLLRRSSISQAESYI